MNPKTKLLIFLLLLTIGLTANARIKLVALPERAATIIRLDNARATLIEEERVLTLQKGLNKVDFSWNGVSIDPDSIRLKILSHPDEVTLLNVSYPPNEAALLNVSYPPNEAALVWQISTADAVQENVRISYLLSNIDRLITYKALADKAETKVDLKSFLVLRNFSGEDFDLANVQLDYGQAFERGIKHEETKQMLFFQTPDVPIEKVWTFDAAKLPWDPQDLENRNVGIPVSYRITNTSQAKLGKFALWNGKARIFQDDGHESTIFLGEDFSKLVPVGEKMELYIGDSRDVVVTQHKMKDKKINVRRDRKNRIVLYDTDELITAEIENFKDSPAVLTVIEHIPGQWDMEKCNIQYKRKDASTLEFEIQLAPHDKKELSMHYHRRNIRP